jgi:hypothetical protein
VTGTRRCGVGLAGLALVAIFTAGCAGSASVPPAVPVRGVIPGPVDDGLRCPQGYLPGSSIGIVDYADNELGGHATPEAAIRAGGRVPAAAAVLRVGRSEHDFEAVLDGKLIARYELYPTRLGRWRITLTQTFCYQRPAPAHRGRAPASRIERGLTTPR